MSDSPVSSAPSPGTTPENTALAGPLTPGNDATPAGAVSSATFAVLICEVREQGSLWPVVQLQDSSPSRTGEKTRPLMQIVSGKKATALALAPLKRALAALLVQDSQQILRSQLQELLEAEPKTNTRKP